jgi:hypothetical protein
MTDPESILQLGIAAAKDKNTEEARSLFRLLTREDPENLQGWLWLAGVAETRDEKRSALENALQIDPDNQAARQAMQKLENQPAEPEQPTITESGPTPAVATEAPAGDDDDPFAELDDLSDVFGQDPGAVRRAQAAEPVQEGADRSEPASAAEPGRRAGREWDTSERSAAYAQEEESMSQSGSNNTLRILLGVAVLLAVLAVLMVVFNIPGRFFGGDDTVATEPTEQAEDGAAGEQDGAAEATPGTGEEGATPGTGDEGTPPDTGEEGTPPDTGGEGTPPDTGGEGTPPDTGGEGTPPDTGGEGTPPDTGEETEPAEPQPTQAPPQDVSGANPAVVPANTPLESNGWLYDFAQPEYANYFVGNFGQLQTQQGRTVVVLVRVVNRTGQAQPLPPDFFVIKDAQGRIYEPQPQASTAYLTLFGRGPAGAADLSHEEPVPADGLTRSVPLIFDVPPDATDLVLFARSNPDQGWLVLQDVQ